MNVVSLFDGMSCGMIALERCGIEVENYFASEIDKYAIQISNKNYQMIKKLGDVRNVTGYNLPKIDLLIGGSPCQGFSFAGKQLNFNDLRSKLFFEYVRILTELRVTNPNIKFFLENVKMKKECQDIISEILGVQPILIDSALVSAQSRKRLYWTNIPNISQPSNNNIFLKNILESGITDRDKSYCIDANYHKGGNLNQYFTKSRRQLVFLNEEQLQRAYYNYKGKTWKSGNKMGNMKFPDDINKKSRCLTSTIIKGSRETIHVPDKEGIRILTPIEAERLQGLPDNYTEGVSNSQRYKMIGNGWQVDTIEHIFKNLK
jgi:DNA (cytosine-5)-methyltransferase 1